MTRVSAGTTSTEITAPNGWPTNFGVEHANADIVAYLGHDDIWYPTHLEAVLRTARDHNADVVTSIMAIYGPPLSGVCGVAGLFPTGRYTARDFVPPSAIAHNKRLFGGPITWEDPATQELPIDVVFMSKMIGAAKKAASTGELTCFKFNAAWRRDAYKRKDIQEQEAMLARLQSGIDFRSAELFNIIEAAIADRMIKIAAPRPVNSKYWFELNQKNKGVRSRYKPSQLAAVSRPVRFDMRAQQTLFEWHALEYIRPERIFRWLDKRGLWRSGTFRWTGPSRRSTIDLPIRFDRNLKIRIGLLLPLKPDILQTLTVFVHEQSVPHRIAKWQGRDIEIEADIRRDAIRPSERDFGVTLEIGEVIRPCDVTDSPDSRWLGLPIKWIEVRPSDY